MLKNFYFTVNRVHSDNHDNDKIATLYVKSGDWRADFELTRKTRIYPGASFKQALKMAIKDAGAKND